MTMLKTVVCVTVVAHLILISEAAAHNVQIIEVDLRNYNPYDNNKNVFNYRDILTEGIAEIRVKKVPASVGSFIVQVHTYLYPVALSTTKDASSNSINGTNTGLAQVTNGSAVYKFFAVSDPSIKIFSLISVVIYDKQAPIPGGCNLSFKTELAPYQLVKLLNEMVMVDSQAPSIPGTLCERAHANIEFYHLYLSEHDPDKETYFDGVIKMMTVDAIRTYGNKIPSNPYTPFKNYYSAYRGIGAVFGIIATFKNETSAYVPAVSYACDVLNWDADCNGPITLHWKCMCALLLFCGFFLCFFGHRFFKVSLFMFGFTAGACITYVALVAGYDLSFEDSTLTAFGFGVIYGTFWLFLWWRFGVPFFSILLAFITTGTLISCIMFYSRVQDMESFRSNVIYWLLTVFIVLAYTTVLCTFSALGHILSCSLLGSFAFIAALSHYVGANLQYIAVNMFRRITIENFNLAMVDPPYQVKDINLTITWIVFLLCGIYSQICLQRGKPPFPPHRAFLFERQEHLPERPRERTPLLFNIPSGVVYSRNNDF